MHKYKEDALLVVKELYKFYQDPEKQYVILKELDFITRQNEIVGIIGPSGIGKTTFIRILTLLEPFDFGKIAFKGKDVTKFNEREIQDYRSKEIGIIWQSYDNLFSSLNVEENMLFSAISSGLSYSAANEEINSLLKQFDLHKLADRYPKQLSGGEKQIASFLTQIVKKPTLILADEPTSRVDSKMTEKLLTFLNELKDRNDISIVLTTHDEIIMHAPEVDRCLKLYDGKLNPIN